MNSPDMLLYLIEKQKASAYHAAVAPSLNDPPPSPDTGDNYPTPSFDGNPADDAQTLAKILADYYADPNNLKLQEVLLNAIVTLNNTTVNGKSELTDPAITQALGSFAGSENLTTFLTNIISSLAELTFFQDGGNIGPSGVGGWLALLSQSITGGKSPLGDALKNFIDNEMPTQMQFFQTDHTDAQGNLYWDVTIDGNTTRYYWNNLADRSFIMDQLRGSNNNFYQTYLNADGNGFNEMIAEFRKAYIDDLFKKYGTDNIFLIIMLLMAGNGPASYNSQYTTQMNGQTNTTTADTKFTNLIQQLSSLFGNIGSFSGNDGMDFMKKLNMIAADMGTSIPMAGVAGQFNSQTFDAFMNQSVTFSPDNGKTTVGPITLGTLYQGIQNGTYPADYMSDGLASLTSASPGTESPGYRALLDAMTSGGSLLTQQSKAVTTESSVLSQLMNSVDNLGALVADGTKSGSYMSFISQIINAFKSQ